MPREWLSHHQFPAYSLEFLPDTQSRVRPQDQPSSMQKPATFFSHSSQDKNALTKLRDYFWSKQMEASIFPIQ